MGNFVLGSFVDRGIYHRVWNGDTSPLVVSVAGKVARVGRAGLAPCTRAVWLGLGHEELSSVRAAVASERNSGRWPAGVARSRRSDGE